jgi:hypothetical protein
MVSGTIPVKKIGLNPEKQFFKKSRHNGNNQHINKQI